MKHLFFFLILTMLVSSGCYTFRFQTKHGNFKSDPFGDGEGFYRDKDYVELKDTLVSGDILSQEATINLNCESGLYSVEIQTKFKHWFRNFFTGGNKKKVTIKYVCIEPDEIE